MQIVENTPTRLRVRFSEPSQAPEPQRPLKSRLLSMLWMLAFTVAVLLLVSWRVPHMSVLRCDHDGETGVACSMEQQHVYGTQRTDFARGRVADVRLGENLSEDARYHLILADVHGEEVGRMAANKTTDLSAIQALLQQSRRGHAEVRTDDRSVLAAMGIGALVMLLGSGFSILKGPANQHLSEIDVDSTRQCFRCLFTGGSGQQRSKELEWETVLAAVWQASSKTGTSAGYGVVLTDGEGSGARIGPLASRGQAVELLDLLAQHGFSDTPRAG